MGEAPLFDFIRGSELAVVFVSAHSMHALNRVLARRLEAEHAGLAVRAVSLGGLLRSGPQVLRYLHQGLRSCGAPSAFGVLPGYYLFRRGVMLAWDSGLPGFTDVSALAQSALLGAVWSGVSSDMAFIRQALELAADQASAERMVLLFGQAIADAEAQRKQPYVNQAPPADELYWAYQVLGVLPTASDREVHEAWRRRRAETHPDHAGSDPDEFDRRSRISRDINLARDIIVKHRHPGTRGATHAWAS
jgi:DnaJ domain